MKLLKLFLPVLLGLSFRKRRFDPRPLLWSTGVLAVLTCCASVWLLADEKRRARAVKAGRLLQLARGGVFPKRAKAGFCASKKALLPIIGAVLCRRDCPLRRW